MEKFELEKLKQVNKATTAIGFATGVLEMLAIVAQGLSDKQREGIKTAIDGLRSIDALELAYWKAQQAGEDNA